MSVRSPTPSDDSTRRGSAVTSAVRRTLGRGSAVTCAVRGTLGRGFIGRAFSRSRTRVVQLSLPRRRKRRPWTLIANLFLLVVLGGLRSWRRNGRLVAPALGTMALLLLLGGALGMGAVAARTLLVYEAQQASLLHVFLRDDATDDSVSELRRSLAAQPHVRSVLYVDKEQTLQRAKRRPGLSRLADIVGANPFPATLEVQIDAPENVAAVASVASRSPTADPTQPTSYDRDTYGQLQRVFLVGAAIAGGFALIVAFIAYAVSSNSLRAVALARREELVTMQLLGASAWLLRSRLSIEGALTGGLAGLLAAVVLGAGVTGAANADSHLFVQILPGVTNQLALAFAAALIVAGAAMGGAGSLFALRRLRA